MCHLEHIPVSLLSSHIEFNTNSELAEIKGKSALNSVGIGQTLDTNI